MGNLLLTAPPDRSQQLMDTVQRDTYSVPKCRVQLAEEPMFSVSMGHMGLSLLRASQPSTRIQATAGRLPCLSFHRLHVKVAALCDVTNQ